MTIQSLNCYLEEKEHEIKFCQKKHCMSDEDFDALVSRYRRDSLINGKSHIFRASGAMELIPDNVKIDEETARRAIDILQQINHSNGGEVIEVFFVLSRDVIHKGQIFKEGDYLVMSLNRATNYLENPRSMSPEAFKENFREKNHGQKTKRNLSLCP